MPLPPPPPPIRSVHWEAALQKLSSLIVGASKPEHFPQIHALLLKSAFFLDTFVAGIFLRRLLAVNPLRSLPYARSIFDQIRNPNTFLCNTLIRAYLRSQNPVECLGIYHQLRIHGFAAVDTFSLSLALQASGKAIEGRTGRKIHAHVVRHGFCSDLFVQTALVEMYSKLGDVLLARQVLDEMPFRDVTVCNVMLAGYVERGDVRLARSLFDVMPIRDLCSWNTMIHGYAVAGDVGTAREVFDGSRERDLVSWSSMISVYARSRKPNEALGLFHEMQLAGIAPDCITLVSVLSACGDLGALGIGKAAHKYIKKNAITIDLKTATSLIDMYARCGDISSSMELFDKMPKKDVLAWNAMISGLAKHGKGKVALEFFSEMIMQGIEPNDVTFVGVLSACGHVGLVKEGREHFKSMRECYGLSPKIEHYGCMVDLLGKAGHVEDARRLAGEMPFEPDAVVWRALLGACQMHKNPELAEEAIIKLIELEPHVDGHYVLLSNIYSNAKRWDDVAGVRRMMKCRGVQRVPGCSSIEIGSKVYEFFAGDWSHPRSDEIDRMLEEMLDSSKQLGYRPATSLVLQDIDEQSKERVLARHSEKLAIAFGFLNTTPKSCILVVKNLRTCEDCHSFIKLLPLVYDREIIVRDRNRFHHFAGGECSCKDYW